MYNNAGTYSLSCDRIVKCSVTAVGYGHWKVALQMEQKFRRLGVLRGAKTFKSVINVNYRYRSSFYLLVKVLLLH